MRERELVIVTNRFAFAGKADLPQLDTEGQLVVDDVIHEAKIRVDERGTEAVAISTAAIINYSRK